MPYIRKEEREELAKGTEILTAGQLNYTITILIMDYLKSHGASYQIMNDIVGAVEGAKVEFQRRIVAPYEDKKAKENGDVY